MMKTRNTTITKPFKFSRLALATSTAIFATLGVADLHAQEKNNQGDEYEVIEVKGIRSSVIAGLDVKRSSDDIVDAVSSEDMGKFPDTNLAEALQRIPDVAIDRDGGEGRKVTIRGLGPEFNSVLLNGRKIATTEPTRAFSFDTLASELVSEMVVYKTQSANLSEGALGGTVDVKTARPLNYDGLGLIINGTLKGAYEENTSKTTPQASLMISNTFMDGKLGALFGATYQKRENTTYSVNTSGIRTEGVFLDPSIPNYSNLNYDPLYRPVELDRGLVNDKRERLGLNGVLQYSPTNDLDITIDFVYSTFDVETNNPTKLNWLWDVVPPADIVPGSKTEVDSNGVLTTLSHNFVGPWGPALQGYNHIYRSRQTKNKMFGANVNYSLNDETKLEFDAGWSSAGDDNKGRNKRRSSEITANSDLAGQTFEIDLTQAVPTVANVEQFSAHNPNMSKTLRVRRQWNDGIDVDATNYQFSIDVENISFENLTIYTGLQYEVSKKSNDSYMTPDDVQILYHHITTFYPADRYNQVFTGIIDVDSTKLGQPASVDNDILAYDIDAFDALLNDPTFALAASAANPDGYAAFVANNSSFDAAKTGDSFEVEEKVTAIYLQGKYDFMLGDMDGTLIGGLRYTKTDLNSTGFSRVLTNLQEIPCPPPNEVRTCLDPTYADADGPDGLSKQTLSNSYNNVLPSATLNLNISEDLVLRVAASKSLTRPFLEDMAPKFRTGQISEVTRTAQSNNEALTPYSSFNLDASLEWYFSEGAVAALAVYSKDISDFIIKETVPNVIVDTIQNEKYREFNVTRPVNSTDDLNISGATFNLTQTFDSGFGYQFNITKVNTDNEFDGATFDSSKPALPGLGDSMNLVAFYEKGPFAARVAYNKRDEFLRTAQYQSGYVYGDKFEEPVFAESYDQVDARVSYELIEDQTTVFLEAVNLTESTLRHHGRFDNIFVNYANFGRRFVLGVSSSF